eukprot:m.35351 g.35351  ORF g.35351 m.35351 type:complete len:1063 (+) comp8874_c0_seq1:81-3269(+)
MLYVLLLCNVQLVLDADTQRREFTQGWQQACTVNTTELNCQFLETKFSLKGISPTIRSIRFVKTQVVDLSGSPFILNNHIASESSTRVEHISLARVSLSSLGEEAFANFLYLNSIDISSNEITTLNQESFSGLRDLVNLNINDNAITWIHGNAFSVLSRLRKLSLMRNMLTTLHDLRLPKSLQELHLQDNSIRAIKPNALALALVNLPMLNMTGNSLILTLENEEDGHTKVHSYCHPAVLPKTVKVPGEHTCALKLKSSTVCKIYKTRLEKIVVDCRKKQLRLVPTDFHTEVFELHLEDNLLWQLEASDFQGLTFLEKLFLERNGIQRIEFGCLQRIRIINMDSNPSLCSRQTPRPLSCTCAPGYFGDGSFCVLQEDAKTACRSEPIDTIYKDEGTIDLLSLDCSNLDLEVVPFGIPNNTVSLNLNQNKIPILLASHFKELVMLQELHIEKNNVLIIENGLFDRERFPLLRILSMSGNPSECSFVAENVSCSCSEHLAKTLTGCCLRYEIDEVCELEYTMLRLLRVDLNGLNEGVSKIDDANSELENEAVEDGTQAKSLSYQCQDNGIHTVPYVASTERARLIQYLDLSFNSIGAILAHDFDMMINLESLNMESNRISLITLHAFDQLKELKYVNLNNNELKLLPTLFNKLDNRNHNSIQVAIFLMSNKIVEVDKAQLLAHQHDKLEMANNPSVCERTTDKWKCICSSDFSGDGSFCRKRPIMKEVCVVDHDEYRTFVVTNCAGKGIWTVPSGLPKDTRGLDLSNNRLTFVSRNDFEGLDLIFIDFSGNLGTRFLSPNLFAEMKSLEWIRVSSADDQLCAVNMFNDFPRKAVVEVVGFNNMTSSHVNGCSKIKSRVARQRVKNMFERLFVSLDVENQKDLHEGQQMESISVGCPLLPVFDAFRLHENFKYQNSGNKFTCGYCGKSFKGEEYFDRHMDNRHSDKLNLPSSTCTSDFCDMFHCNCLETCDSKFLHKARLQCETVLLACIGDHIKARTTIEKECNQITCESRAEFCIETESSFNLLVGTVTHILITGMHNNVYDILQVTFQHGRLLGLSLSCSLC